MEKDIKWLYHIALVLIGCSALSIFGVSTKLSMVLSIVSLAASALLLLVARNLDKSLSKMLRYHEDLVETLASLKYKTKRSNEVKQELSKALTEETEQTTILKQENAALKAELKRIEEIGNYSIALDTLRNFRNHISTKYYEQLRATSEPLTEQSRQEIIDSTINMAMLAFDMAETVDWSLSNREEQKLNMAIISDLDARQKSIDEAIIITDNPTMTPKWARLLGETFKDVVSKDANIIYSGYKIML